MDAIRKDAAKRRAVIECTIATIAVVCVVGALIWSVVGALNTPEVVYSWNTKECLYVQYMDGTKGTCDKLPARYDRVWGE